jgi:hypothetical protein
MFTRVPQVHQLVPTKSKGFKQSMSDFLDKWGDPSIPDKPDGLRGPNSCLPNFMLNDAVDIERAIRTLNETGVRVIDLDGVFFVGVWSDLDGPDIREALQIAELGDLGIRYLDGDDVPAMYKERDVEGEPVPWRVLRAMQVAREEPWIVRDRMLAEMARSLHRTSCSKEPARHPAQDWSKLTRVTPFQRGFFSDLAKIPAETFAELMEKSSRRGILRECAEAYWRFKTTHQQSDSDGQ